MKTFGKLRFEEGSWKISCEPHVAIRLRRLFARISGQFGEMKITHTDEVARDLLWFTERYPMEIDEASRAHLVDEATRFDTRFREFTSVLSGELQPRAFEMALPPRPYQSIAIELALRQKRLLVADDLGLGKTCIGIGTLTDPEMRPCLVVTLTHLPKQWANEIAKFAPDLKVHIVKTAAAYDIVAEMAKKKRGRKKKPKGSVGEQLGLPVTEFPDVIIMNYHKLHGWAEALAPKIRSVIYDEIQELRHQGSQKYGAADELSRRASNVLGLSATPIYNRGGEMFNVMEIIKPDCLGSWGEFATEWVGTGFVDRAKASVKDPRAFGTYLRENGLMIRRTKEDVGLELPPVIRVPHYVESDTDALERIESDIAELARLVLSRESTRFERRDAAGQMDWRLRQATGLAKAPYVADFTEVLLMSNEVPKIVMFGWHRDVYEIWNSRLKDFKPAMYTGSESSGQKNAAFERFRDDPECRILIISLRSGAGLDGLQYVDCDTIVFGELDWSPAIHDQCVGRLARFGQEKRVTAYFLVSDEGSDPFVSDVLGVKRAQIDGVKDPLGQVLQLVDRGGSRIKEMAAEYLRVRGIGFEEPDDVDLGDVGSDALAM